ncbi:thioredoxin family protein [endosymbiont of Lamellibrachia barhami]|uniref:thioredoxin family protein n=1 Tax=endosymbiont of Lamellibrachia barhami TaxID=205975 RepID=UPI001C4B85C6|nr:thioredoxin fold domain-containing protein [endosymbiont of Lamellibrachia barhami]
MSKRLRIPVNGFCFFFHQDGCPYCAKLLNENWSLRPLVEKTQENFEVIAINIWGDQEVTDLRGTETTEKRFSESLKVMYTPTLIFLDEAGRQALRINGYYPPHKFEAALDYVAGHLERKQPYRDYLASVQPQAVSGNLHREVGFLPLPLDLRAKARESNKPLLVLMEQKACSACDELHGKIMRIPAVRKTLDAFDIALVDVWSGETLTTPGGVQRTVSEWTKALGIQYVPSMLFFDPAGKEVFRAEAFLKTFHTHAAMETRHSICAQHALFRSDGKRCFLAGVLKTFTPMQRWIMYPLAPILVNLISNDMCNPGRRRWKHRASLSI